MNHLTEGRLLHSGRYRPDIDGVRAVAVLSVVFCHAFPDIFPGGFVGVDIFFVISGYLITKIIISDVDLNRFSMVRFYERRIRRVFPALLAVYLFVICIGWVSLFGPEFKLLGKHVSASAIFSENLLLWSEVGYFDISSHLKPTLHLWSLAVEEQFYILWPIIAYFSIRSKMTFSLVIGFLALASFGVNLYSVVNSPVGAYYSPLSRAWELMIGCLLAYIRATSSPIIQQHRDSISIMGALLVVASIITIGPDSDFPGAWALMPTIGASFWIAAGDQAWFNRVVLSRSIMVWVGLISYPLYLWHWPILSFGYIVFGGLSAAKAAACVIASLIAAGCTYVLVERPIRRNHSSRWILPLLSGSMCVIVMSGALIMVSTFQPRLKDFDAPTRNEWDFLNNLEAKGGRVAGSYVIHPERPAQVLYIGDSHLAQYAGRLDRVISMNPASPGAVFAVLPACFPIEGWNPKRPDLCAPARQAAYQLATSDKFSTVVIGAAWDIYFSEPGIYKTIDGLNVSLATTEGRRLALDQLKLRIDELVASGKEVAIILDNPVSDSLNPSGPKLRLSLSTTNFESNGKAVIDEKVRRIHQETVVWARSTKALVIDPTDYVCELDWCSVTASDGQPLYRNRDHFNPDWAINNAVFVDQTLTRASSEIRTDEQPVVRESR